MLSIIVAQEDNSWLWPVTGLVGLVAAVVAWTAEPGQPRGRALIAVIAGGVIFVLVFGWAIVGAITGNL